MWEARRVLLTVAAGTTDAGVTAAGAAGTREER